MGKYIIKRTFFAFLTLIAVVTITFFLMRSIPGDPLAGMARALPEETKQAFYAKYGLDKPLFEQYLIYMKGLFHGDLGESIRYAGRPVMKTIAETSPISGLYGGIALVLGTLTGVILGIVAALNKNRWPDYIVMFIAILGTTLPVFVLISLAQWVFGVKLGWLPPSGWGELKHMIRLRFRRYLCPLCKSIHAGYTGSGLCADRESQRPVGFPGYHPSCAPQLSDAFCYDLCRQRCWCIYRCFRHRANVRYSRYRFLLH